MGRADPGPRGTPDTAAGTTDRHLAMREQADGGVGRSPWRPPGDRTTRSAEHYFAQLGAMAVDPRGDIADGAPRVALRIPTADRGDRTVIGDVPAQVRGTVLVGAHHFHRAAGHFPAQRSGFQ